MLWKDLIKIINSLWPLSDAEHWDNCGLSVGNYDDKVSKVIVALDFSHEIMDEAIKIGADGIITHHPLIFSPLKKIDTSKYPGNMISKALKNGIGLLSLHTNLDVAKNGPSYEIAKNIELKNIEFLQTTRFSTEYKLVVFVPENSVDIVRETMCEAGAGVIGEYSNCSFGVKGRGTFLGNNNSNPVSGKKGVLEKVEEVRLEMNVRGEFLHKTINIMKKNHPYEEVAYDVYKLDKKSPLKGMGVIGTYDLPLKIEEVAKKVMDYLKLENVTIVDAKKDIKKVAIVSGSGTSMMHTALNRGADLLLTGDITHHKAVESRILGLNMIDATHYGTEKITKNIIADELNEKLEGKVKFYTSKDEFDSLSTVRK